MLTVVNDFVPNLGPSMMTIIFGLLPFGFFTVVLVTFEDVVKEACLFTDLGTEQQGLLDICCARYMT